MIDGVKHVTVSDGYAMFDGPTQTRAKVVKYYVGTSGPFTETYKLTEFTADKVKADMQRQVDTLKAIGANLT